jgi:hypothetical protein
MIPRDCDDAIPWDPSPEDLAAAAARNEAEIAQIMAIMVCPGLSSHSSFNRMAEVRRVLSEVHRRMAAHYDSK